MKKYLIYIGAGIIIFIVGLAAGLITFNYYLKINKEKICSFLAGVKQISVEQIKDLSFLNPGQTINGHIKSRKGNQIAIDVSFTNTSNPKDVKNTEVKFAINPKDEILRDNKPSSANDIKIGDYVSVKILGDRKIIYLTAI